ncbi:MAG: HAAS signaling domain-containing protein [Streptosporangiaceae bacterium]
MNDDDLVAGYLGRLVQAARRLPPDRRAELIDEIADHIEQGRTVSEASGPGLRDVLRRLGEPEAIAAAASDSAADSAGSFGQPTPAITQPAAGRGPRWQRRLDLAAVMLTLASGLLAPVSFVLALLGWVVGIVMLLLSPRWPRRAKVLGAATGTLALPLFGGLLATLAKTWYWQHAGPFGWHTGAGPFISSILVTAAVVAVTLVGVRLLRYPLSQPGGPGPAMTEGRIAAGPPAAAASEPATSATAGG